MKQEGVAGLFKGVVPVMIRAFPANAVSEELWVLISFVVSGQGDYVVFLYKTPFSHFSSLHPGRVPANVIFGSNPAMGWHPKGKWKYP